MSYTTLSAIMTALDGLLGRLILPDVDGVEDAPQPVNLLTTTEARDNNRGYVALAISDAVADGPNCKRRAQINFSPQYHMDDRGRALMHADAPYLEALVYEIHTHMPALYAATVPPDSIDPAMFIIEGVTFNRAVFQGSKAIGAVAFAIDYHVEPVTLTFRPEA
jgi:hypothetical protein